MDLQMFTIHDIKAQAYLQPFFCPNVAVATRSFATAANDLNTEFARNPADYTLFSLGSFNQSNGTLDLLTTAVPICKAIDLLQPEPMGPKMGSFKRPVEGPASEAYTGERNDQ